MGKREKLTEKLTGRGELKWADLTGLLSLLGFSEIQGRGSRVKFSNGNPKQLISLHKPHPGNVVPEYAKNQIVEKLKSAGLL